jgi:hypothetical protein
MEGLDENTPRTRIVSGAALFESAAHMEAVGWLVAPGKLKVLTAVDVASVAPPTKPAPAPSPPEPLKSNLGRPTDRDMLRSEADWRLRHEPRPPSLAQFARDLREWLQVHGKHRSLETGEVMKAGTIEDHVRPLWSAR